MRYNPFPHSPHKKWGQNFLQDESIILRLIQLIDPKSDETFLEVGPGYGVLSKYLLSSIKKLIAIEIDRDLCQVLTTTFAKELQLTPPRFELIGADALRYNYSQLFHQNSKIRIVGNLPYNISTQLILKFLENTAHIHDLYFMVQREVAERLAAMPHSRDYGRLSIMAQIKSSVTILFNVPPEAFFPIPKVNSTIVRLIPFSTPPYKIHDHALFENLIRQAFSMRRKTLRNTLKKMIESQALANLGIDANLRPEQISIENYVKICNFLYNGHREIDHGADYV